jgi:AraC-like DNA-binding protein
LPVKIVAKSVGYESRSYFSRVFRAGYGHNPASFRTLGTSPQHEPRTGVPASSGRLLIARWLDQ